VPTLATPWFIPAGGVPATELQMAGAEVEFFDSQFDLQRNIALIEDAIQKGVDGICQFPMDSAGLVPVVDQAWEAGIPHFSIDTDVFSDNVIHRATMDQWKKGEIAGEIMVETAEALDKQLNVYIVHGAESYPTVVLDRVDGFLAQVEGHPLITTTLGPDTAHMDEPAMNAIVDTFPAHPELNAIYGTGAMFSGKKAALLELGRWHPVGHPDHVVVVGQDGDPTALELIRENFADGVASNSSWAIGDLVAKAVINYVIFGESVPRLIELPAHAITPENVDISPYGGPKRWGDMVLEEPDVMKWPSVILEMEEFGMPTPTYQEYREMMGCD
jgi:ribose transport system substrate-binding protein